MVKTVSLTPFSRSFLDLSFHWLNDPEIRFLTDSPVVTREGQEAWFAGLDDRTDYRVWGVLADGRPVGVCGIKHIREREGEYFGYIGEKAFWGQGIGRRMMALTESRSQAEGLGRIHLCVLKENERAVRLYEGCGYGVDKSDDKYHYMSKLL